MNEFFGWLCVAAVILLALSEVTEPRTYTVSQLEAAGRVCGGYKVKSINLSYIVGDTVICETGNPKVEVYKVVDLK